MINWSIALARWTTIVISRISILFTAFASTCALAVLPTQAKPLPVVRSLSNTSYGYVIVHSPVRAGRIAQRFELRPGDCFHDNFWDDCSNDRSRTEVRIDRKYPFGSNFWVGFSLYVPRDFKTSRRVRTTVGQLQQHGGPSGVAQGLPSFPPVMQMHMIGNEYTADFHILSGQRNHVRDVFRSFALAKVSKMRGHWTDIQMHLDSSIRGGHAEIYVNGQKKADLMSFIRFRPEHYYVKYGIYNSFISRNKGPMPRQVVYFDEVKLGQTRREVQVDRNHPVD